MKIPNAYNNFPNMFLLVYRHWVRIKISFTTAQVPETLYSIINTQKQSSKTLAIGSLM